VRDLGIEPSNSGLSSRGLLQLPRRAFVGLPRVELGQHAYQACAVNRTSQSRLQFLKHSRTVLGMRTFKLTNAQHYMILAALSWVTDSDYNEFTEPLTTRQRAVLDRAVAALARSGPPFGC
jgi:hypothetical protein